jgi:hypothetical protein
VLSTARRAVASSASTICADPGAQNISSEMGLIDNDMRDIVAGAKRAFVATVNPKGSPNLSPKRRVRVDDDHHVAFIDISSPASFANLSVNQRIDIAVAGLLGRRGYRFSGPAKLHQPGSAVHTWLHQWLLGLNGPGYSAKPADLVNVARVQPIPYPGYWRFSSSRSPAWGRKGTA